MYKLFLVMFSLYLVSSCSVIPYKIQIKPKSASKLVDAVGELESDERPLPILVEATWFSEVFSKQISDEDNPVRCYLLDTKKENSRRSFHGYYVIDSTMRSAYAQHIRSAVLGKQNYETRNFAKQCDFSPMVAFCFGEEGRQRVLLDFSCHVAQCIDLDTNEDFTMNFDVQTSKFEALCKKVFNAAAFEKRKKSTADITNRYRK